MLRVLRQRNFGLLWTAGLISLIGDWVLVVGLPIEVYRRTGSTLATMGMLLASLIPTIALGSIAGVFVDRWDRRRLMVVVNVLLALSLLPLLAVDVLGIWVAYAVLVGASCLEQLFQPAEAALLPNLLEGDEPGQLVTANALNNLNNQLARIIGPVIGGVVVAAGGLTAVAIVDGVSFLVAAILLLAIRTSRGRADRGDEVPARHDSVEHAAASAWAKLRGEWREGLGILLGHPVLRALLVFHVITRIGEGVMGTLFVPWATDAVGTDAAGYSLILSGQAVGGLIGAVVVGRFGSRVDPLRMLIGAAIAFGVIDNLIFVYPAFYPVLAPAVIGMVIVGVPAAGMGAAIATLQQTSAADRHRGRVVGAMMALGALGSLTGAIAAGFLGEIVPVIPLLVVQGTGYVVGGLVVWRLTRRARRLARA